MTNKVDISKVLRTHGRELGIRYVVTTTKSVTTYRNREAAMLRNSLMKK